MITKEQLTAQIEVLQDKPVKDIVLVSRYVIQEKTKGGVHKGGVATPEETKEQAKLYVIAIPTSSQVEYKVGDIIKASRYATTDIESVIPEYEVGMVRTHDVMTYRSFDCKSCDSKCEGCE